MKGIRFTKEQHLTAVHHRVPKGTGVQVRDHERGKTVIIVFVNDREMIALAEFAGYQADEPAVPAFTADDNHPFVPEADGIREKLLTAVKSQEEANKIWNVFIAKEEYLNAALDKMTFEENPEFQKKIFGM